MDNQELLKELGRLMEENKRLLRLNQEKDQQIYELNQRLDKALLAISSYQEKYNIERTRAFLPKGEKLNEVVINEAEEIAKEAKKTNLGKKYKKKAFDYEKYVQETRYLEPGETHCEYCGHELVKASEKVRYCVEIEPAKIKVIKLVKITKKCPRCNKGNNKIYYPLSSEALGSSLLTPSLGAYLLYHKYELGIPFEHLAHHISASTGLEISKQDLANYAARMSKATEGIYNRMKEDLLNNGSKVMHSDETTLAVSKRPEEDRSRKKSYVYVYNSSFYDEKQIRIYDFRETRSIDPTTRWLRHYDGILVCDNYEGYNKLKKENGIRLQKCWAHVRRRYVDIVKNLKEAERRNSKAYQVLGIIEKMFRAEKEYRKKKLLPYQLEECRKKDIPPLKEELERALSNIHPARESALYRAVEYTKSCWDDLFTFVDHGYVEMTNNAAERAVKPFVIQRKVFQTSGSYAGAAYTTKLFSIIQTCKINNVNVEKYLEYVFANLNRLPLEELLPYSKNAPKNDLRV